MKYIVIEIRHPIDDKNSGLDRDEERNINWEIVLRN